MTFDAQERSTQDGRPIALYRLDWGRTSWFYTSADRSFDREEEVNGEVRLVRYEAKAIKDSGMVQGSSAQNDFTVSGPSDLPIVRLFRGTPPSQRIVLTVRRQHFGEADAPIYWKGLVYNVKRPPSEACCDIIGRPISASLDRTGLRLSWSRECPHFLYDNGCRVNPNAFRVNGTLEAFAGNSMTVTLAEEKPAGWFRGGYIEWTASDEGTIERRFIEDHVSEGGSTAELVIFGLVDFVEVGAEVALFPGCNRTPEECSEKFNNIDNYGGFWHMPTESPFVNPIW